VILRRKQREWGSLAADPNTPYYVGRLLGANEMAVALLARPEESQNAQRISEVLGSMLGFFMTDLPPGAGAVTNVLPPPVPR
jgi:hypothetical protein